jgi:hypothetical protein
MEGDLPAVWHRAPDGTSALAERWRSIGEGGGEAIAFALWLTYGHAVVLDNSSCNPQVMPVVHRYRV